MDFGHGGSVAWRFAGYYPAKKEPARAHSGGRDDLVSDQDICGNAPVEKCFGWSHRDCWGQGRTSPEYLLPSHSFFQLELVHDI
jgi:hypothetical protein